MASILKRVYRIFNGTDWDTAHFETDSEQVKHDTTTVKAKLDAFKSGALATVVNNLTTTAANTVLDGRQGKALNDKITAINSALELFGELKYTGQALDGVTSAYSSANFLRYDDDAIRPESSKFANTVWMIVLHGTVTTASSSIYIATLGSAAGDAAVMRIGSSGSIYPEVRKDSNGALYAAWSGERTAYMRANIFKLH